MNLQIQAEDHLGDLRARRRGVRLTIEMLAVLAGVSSSTVERIERGEGRPHRSTLRALDAVLAHYENALAGRRGQ